MILKKMILEGIMHLKHLMESCRLKLDNNFSFNYFPYNFFVREISKKESGIYKLLCTSKNRLTYVIIIYFKYLLARRITIYDSEPVRPT